MNRYRRLMESFWFLPAVFVVVALVLAQVALVADAWLSTDDQPWLPQTLVLGVEGSRGLLAAIGGSVLAVAGTTFSITISVIATASSTYGPRLVRNFMADRRNQAVLGLFVATFAYSVMVLRAITSADDDSGREAFVPLIAVYLGIVLAMVNVAALVYFLHHIAASIQVPQLIRRVRGELQATALALYGEEQTADQVAPTPLGEPVAVVLAERAGFVVDVDDAKLIRAAREADGVVELLAPPGTHVIQGEPLARVSGDTEALTNTVRHLVRIGGARTTAQDMHFALQQIVEMAVRALSPGINDPYTARNAVDEIASGLVTALRNPTPHPGRVDERGMLRLVWSPPDAETLVDAVYDDLRHHGANEPGVIHGALHLAERLLRVAPPGPAARIRVQVDELIRAAEAAGLPEIDLERLRSHCREVLQVGAS